MEVAMYLGRCYWMRVKMRSDQLAKKSASMALNQVSMVGLNATWWRYVTRSTLVCMMCMVCTL